MQQKQAGGILLLLGGFTAAYALAEMLPRAELKPPTPEELPGLARQALASDSSSAVSAATRLRLAGPAGIAALRAALLENGWENGETGHALDPKKPEARPAVLALERVGMQHDNWASKLYWYTDLAKAKKQAQEKNKPILSLRLLGNLDEEFSCANSRFFRTALYPNTNIRDYLSNHYILHWQSVRPAPKVTIDFGNGRKIETTVTGNSIHYILDPRGRIVDALPGLNGPQAFYRWIVSVEPVALNSAELEGEARREYLNGFHRNRLQTITRLWQNDFGILKTSPERLTLSLMRKTSTGAFEVESTPRQEVERLKKRSPGDALISIVPISPDGPVPSSYTDRVAKLTALTGRYTIDGSQTLINRSTSQAWSARLTPYLKSSKIYSEQPILQAITVSVPGDRAALKRSTDDMLWSKMARLHLTDAALDEMSLRVLRSKSRKAQDVIPMFEQSISEDTVRNEYGRHAIIHEWLIETPNVSLDDFNRRVYDEMFLTPDSDPWLGLLPKEAYTGLANDGVTERT